MTRDEWKVEYKESDRLVHEFKYGETIIPIFYDKEGVSENLEECTIMITLLKEYIKDNNIVFSDRECKLLIAQDVISSSYIEGYEPYLIPELLIDGKYSNRKDDRAAASGYNAYLKGFDMISKHEKCSNITELVKLWRKMVSYKPFLRNIRKTGVRVGNRFHTAHLAPPAKYVKPLLIDMFETLETYTKEGLDTYDLVRSILFHYLYTYIHPFIDGNGRTARLVEEMMFLESSGLPVCVPISSSILRDRKSYYSSFKKRAFFGESSLDVLAVDITDFINCNLKYIIQGLVFICNELFYSISDLNIDNLEEDMNIFNEVSKEKILEMFDKRAFCRLLLSQSISYTEQENIYTLGKYGILHYKDRHNLILNRKSDIDVD